jgi:phosphotransferase system enzyme I (PtsP)
VPSLLWQLDELMAAVDFVSVGSNDLFQFVMAADRGNTLLSDRFDPLSVPFLRVLRQIAEAGSKSGTPVTLCGELAGRPISAMALIGLGYRSISMSPAAIGPVKAMLCELPAEELTTMLDDLLAKPDGGTDVRGLLKEFADKRDIPL